MTRAKLSRAAAAYGLAAAGTEPDDTLRTAIDAAPQITREHGELLEQPARDLRSSGRLRKSHLGDPQAPGTNLRIHRSLAKTPKRY